MTSGLEMEQACSYIRGAPQAIPSELKDNNFSRINFKADFEAWILEYAYLQLTPVRIWRGTLHFDWLFDWMNDLVSLFCVCLLKT